ncbi:hypothetical protein V8E36_006701 [Tilletia maclaganii]
MKIPGCHRKIRPSVTVARWPPALALGAPPSVRDDSTSHLDLGPLGSGFPRPRFPPWQQVSRISLNINGAPGLVAASGRAFGGRAHADIVATLLHDVALIANLHAEHQRRTTAPLAAPSSPRPAHRAHPLAAYTVILAFTHSCHFGGRVRARFVAMRATIRRILFTVNEWLTGRETAVTSAPAGTTPRGMHDLDLRLAVRTPGAPF